jgi:hypothetical protein
MCQNRRVSDLAEFFAAVFIREHTAGVHFGVTHSITETTLDTATISRHIDSVPEHIFTPPQLWSDM